MNSLRYCPVALIKFLLNRPWERFHITYEYSNPPGIVMKLSFTVRPDEHKYQDLILLNQHSKQNGRVFTRIIGNPGINAEVTSRLCVGTFHEAVENCDGYLMRITGPHDIEDFSKAVAAASDLITPASTSAST